MQKSPTSRKKRPRQTVSPDSDGERRRGRPRVEKPDVSTEDDPKDRRRLQIRMAQRAYRQRKESTLEDLRKRVSELSNTIELMNKAFVECRDRLYSSTLAVDQLRDLQVLSNQFDGYLGAARNPSEEDATASNIKIPGPPPKAPTPIEIQAETVGDATLVSEWLDHAAVAHAAKLGTVRAMGMGYEIDHAEPQDRRKPAQYPFLLPKSDDLVTSERNVKLADFSPFDMTALDGFDHSILRMTQPSPPTTYSFHELTLARRLFRASLESAYHLLLDPTRKLVDFERVFKLSLMGRTRNTILRSLRRVLSKGIDDELDAWHAPLIHIGGSGTHYPRRDSRGNLLPKKQSNYIGLIGPQKLALLEDSTRNNISVDLTVEIAGFEGEWLDPYDVQGYLEESGIFIDPASSFAEAQVPDWMQPSKSSSSISASNRALTPALPPVSMGSSVPFSAGESDAFRPPNSDVGQWNEFNEMELGTVGFSDAQMGSWMNFLPSGQAVKEFNFNAPPDAWDTISAGELQAQTETMLSHGQISSPPKKSILIDVTKFIEVLVHSGVCLGRSPGFRRKDVDRALAIASFDPS